MGQTVLETMQKVGFPGGEISEEELKEVVKAGQDEKVAAFVHFLSEELTQHRHVALLSSAEIKELSTLMGVPEDQVTAASALRFCEDLAGKEKIALLRGTTHESVLR